MPRRLSLVAYKTPLTPAKNELLTRATSASIRRQMRSPVALQAAKSLPALVVRVSGRAAQEVSECDLQWPSSWTRVRQILVVVRLLS